jgi:hypothetical protein
VKKIKKLIMFLVSLVGLAIVLVVVFKVYHYPTLASYENRDGTIYECVRPIKAKSSKAIAGLGHPQGLVPYSQADADKYCHYEGIE